MKQAVALGLAMFAGIAISTTAVDGLHAWAKARGAYETPIWKTITLGTGMATSSSPANECFDGPCAYFLEEEQFTFGASELLTLLLPLRST